MYKEKENIFIILFVFQIIIIMVSGNILYRYNRLQNSKI